MIFGENGTGKTTIIDSIGFVCDQNFGTLDVLKVSDKSCIASVNAKPEDLRVNLTTDGGSWEGKLRGRKIEVSPAGGAPDIHILRRANILRLIEAEPSKRYAELANFIAAPQIEKVETTLRSATQHVSEEVTRFSALVTQAENLLEENWTKEGGEGGTPVEWATAVRKADVSAQNSVLRDIQALSDLIRDLGRTFQSIDLAKTKVQPAKDAYDKALAEQQKEIAKTVNQNPELVRLLQQAQQYVHNHGADQTCPVCTQGVDRTALLQQLAGRIAEMNVLSQASTSADKQKGIWDAAVNSVGTKEDSFIDEASNFAAQVAASTLPFAQESGISLEDRTCFADATKTHAERLAAAINIHAATSTIQTTLNSARDAANKIIGLQNTVATHLDAITRQQGNLVIADATKQRLEKLHEIVSQERKAYVVNVLKEISDDVASLYGALHPGEDLGKVKLSLNERFIGSLDIQGSFHSREDVAPQAFFSESHLDTLGLCVFLALAKRNRTHRTIVILDDVVTSVDESHLDRFITLLHEQEKHFAHTIVTTHYRPWRDRYRNHRAPGGKMEFIELRAWSLGRGVFRYRTKSALEELELELANQEFDRQAIASKAGIFLENTLEYLARRYRCRLPLLEQTAYALAELVNSFPKELLAVLKVEHLDGNPDALTVTATAALKELFDRIKQLSAVRNQVGCHYNFDASLVSDKDVEDFARTALELGKLLVCPESGDFPADNRSGSYWESRKRKVRLYPLVAPTR
jgi:uncharacterized membrane-anchored protein YhcB (DUF1043 family)